MKPIVLKKRQKYTAVGRLSATLLIATGLQILIFPPLKAATVENEITAKGITSAVEDALRYERGVFPNDVDVNTTEGIVTLDGSAENLLTKERAVKIAESIRGVRGVIDRIIVTPVSRPDADILKDVKAALLQDPATASYKVEVSVQSAVAILTGSVGSYPEKQLASRIAKGVKGVKEVRNEVTIDYLDKRTDSEIAADVNSRLQWDIWLNGNLIDAAVKDGKVTLVGLVGNATGKSRAFDDAWVNGVISVDDKGVKTEPWPRNGVNQNLKYAIKPDNEIKQAVQDALRIDPRVSPYSPDVAVEDGVIILGGSVESLKAKTAAEQDAKNIVSVLRVENFLKVRPKQAATDPEMQQQLKAALAWDPLLDNSTIDVAVINRVAYLSGTVDSSFQKAEAQDVASRIKGVVLVRNHLKVEQELAIVSYDWPAYSYYDWPYYNEQNLVSGWLGSKPYLSDVQIKKKIENHFFWSPFVHSADINVTVIAGVATLTGTVGTWIGWNEVDRDAHKSGASAVVNQVDVRKGAWF